MPNEVVLKLQTYVNYLIAFFVKYLSPWYKWRREIMTTKVCQKDVTYWCRVVDDVLDASRAPTSYTDILSPLYPPVTSIFVATESHQETSDTIDASRNLSSSSAE